MSNCFYGKQKANYLTPLERKAIKDSLHPPSSLPPPQEKKKQKMKGGKRTQAAAGPKETGIHRSTTSGKTVKQLKLSIRYVCIFRVKVNPNPNHQYRRSAVNGNIKFSINWCLNFNDMGKILFISFLCFGGLFHSTSEKPASTSTTAPAYGPKPTESKKIFTFASFSSSKPKPKIFVGAAFFNTGKKPKSMYKKTHTVKSSNRSTSSQIKCRTVQKSQQLSSQASAAGITQQGSKTVCKLQD